LLTIATVLASAPSLDAAQSQHRLINPARLAPS
jgi:hypothetical protein